jgi:transcription elongation factor Elf1
MTPSSEIVAKDTISPSWEFHCPRCRAVFSRKVLEISKENCTVVCPNCGETRKMQEIQDFLQYSKHMQKILAEFLNGIEDFSESLK